MTSTFQFIKERVRKFCGSQKPRNICIFAELNIAVHVLEQISREFNFAIERKFRFSILIKNNFIKWKERLSSMKCILEITLQKINKKYISQFLSYHIKNISIFQLPLRVAGVLFIFGQQMLNKTFVDLEYITVILFNKWLAYQWVNISKQIQWFQTSFSIIQCICDLCSAPATWNNLFPFGCGHVIVEINKPFRMNRFYGSKSEFNLDLFYFSTFIKLLSYLTGIPFIIFFSMKRFA